MRAGEGHGAPLPQSVIDAIRRNRVALKGPTQTPFGDPYPVRVADRVYPSVAIALRKELGFYAAVRPVRSYVGVESRYRDVDFIIFRENSEDLYLGIERMVDADTAEAVKRTTRGACERIARFAFEYLRKLGRKRLTVAHKSNVLKLTDGMFLKVAQDVAKNFEKKYPGVSVQVERTGSERAGSERSGDEGTCRSGTRNRQRPAQGRVLQRRSGRNLERAGAGIRAGLRQAVRRGHHLV